MDKQNEATIESEKQRKKYPKSETKKKKKETDVNNVHDAGERLMATVNVKLCFMLSGISAQKAEEEKTGKE